MPVFNIFLEAVSLMQWDLVLLSLYALHDGLIVKKCKFIIIIIHSFASFLFFS